MPANLSPEFIAAEARFKKARTPEERLDALEEMLRTIPKHKGTEKMCADIKTRISKLKTQQESARSSGKKGPSFHVDPEGAAQCVMVGAPNSGKSSLLTSFTNADAPVGDYPYTTIKPQPAMLPFENIAFQLVDLPPVSTEFMEPWITSLIRASDLVLLVAGLDRIDEVEMVIHRLRDFRIELTESVSDVDRLSSQAILPAIILANKKDMDDDGARMTFLRELYPKYSILPVSSYDVDDALQIGRLIYKTLNLIRIYTRAPGREPNFDQPVVLRRGARIVDAAREIHKDFASQLKFARVWGSQVFDGQRVTREYELNEGDQVEFKI